MDNRTTAVKIPQHVEMYWPTLQALDQLGGSASIQEIDERVIRIAGYGEAQQSSLHLSGPQTELAYRLAWVRTHLRLIGAIENSRRGIWAITGYGRSLGPSEMAAIPARLRRAVTPKRDGVPEGPSISAAESASSKADEQTVKFSSTDAEQWREKLLNILLSLSSSDFERLCQRALRESGFTRVDVTGKSGDGGIDGIGVLRINLLSFHVFFQCKRYKGSVGASAIRDLRGAMVGRTDKGLLITTGTFTAEAMREATRDGAPVLDLIDGLQFCDLLKRLKLGVDARQVEEVIIDPGWFSHL